MVKVSYLTYLSIYLSIPLSVCPFIHHYIYRFPCCGKVYPCDVCHDTAEDHPMEIANRMICGYCSREQVTSHFICLSTVYLSVCLLSTVCLSVCLSTICLSTVCLSTICLSVCLLSVCLSVYYLSVYCLSVCLSTICLSVCLLSTVCLSVCLSV